MRYKSLTSARNRLIPGTAIVLASMLGGCVAYESAPPPRYSYAYPSTYYAGYPAGYAYTYNYRPFYSPDYNTSFNTYATTGSGNN